jgi:hypothetical protein
VIPYLERIVVAKLLFDRSGANAGSSGVLHKRSEAFPKLQESQGQSLVTGRVQFVLLES